MRARIALALRIGRGGRRSPRPLRRAAPVARLPARVAHTARLAVASKRYGAISATVGKYSR
jgi:hypothetical protein